MQKKCRTVKPTKNEDPKLTTKQNTLISRGVKTQKPWMETCMTTTVPFRLDGRTSQLSLVQLVLWTCDTSRLSCPLPPLLVEKSNNKKKKNFYRSRNSPPINDENLNYLYHVTYIQKEKRNYGKSNFERAPTRGDIYSRTSYPQTSFLYVSNKDLIFPGNIESKLRRTMEEDTSLMLTSIRLHPS